jgi:hypothetical protein
MKKMYFALKILLIALGYNLGGPALMISVLTIVFNLILTGIFVVWVEKLTRSVYSAQHLAEHLHEKFGIEVHVCHREQGIEQTLL